MGLNYYQIKKNILRARKLVIKATNIAGSGHPGGSFSMAEILGCLFYKYLKFDPNNPQWEDRDRLVLSKGHAAPGLFSNMAVAGYFPESELETLRKFGSKLQGHPDLKCPGVEFCGGSLGTGLSYSIGVALAAKINSKDYHVYTIIGDGESNEGQIWEAAMMAAKYKLDNLTAFLDRNFIQQDSYTEKIMPLDEKLEGDDLSEMWKDASRWKTGDKWRSFGWNVIEIDGHRVEQIDTAIAKANATKGIPTMIISRTIKGKSVEHMEDNPQWHGKAPDSDVVPIINHELDSQFMIAPSIIAGDMTNLANEIKRCVSSRADYIHLDVMDGQFVPNKTFNHDKVKELRHLTVIPFDLHLMINEPVKHVTDYIDAGSDIITVHAEVTDESSFGEIHDLLKQNQVGVGFAINPDTELPEWSYKFLSSLDQLIVMSVVPGKSGQKFIEETHAKIVRLNSILKKHNFSGYIEADGGVNLENIGSLFADGARVFVGGGAIIGQQDVRAAIRDFRTEVLKSRRSILLDKANELGGSDLVNKWISLHIVGEKQEQIKKIAQEAGYI
ncbi:ribulose-phosphate 3-epimerase [Marine Group I thaumarchaeote]|uniref:Ribulose-phosphate 3-epimerase n=1 Tax=Marine Group I thaumarchaeote TaxID=2511932 RepID=A0A7K4MV37_9ARCH|nr:MAG: ribulose-phosphate 3-epimerase [Nitrosopumilus sp. YT1]NMI81812.1 ribulose-phosphate 3-epimerase [Candidatus Nitrosopumilus sp. MTA1]NWJ19750.1 ribulose-phosphate 3-epimerase [Marine Group I thaumarchaeote]NWJ28146.1 ribulose-phosphate 3-epimerase [Marine Group I thaumarchaeote]NWJ56681.1 ribulose-phosphate 3-epimerase [Marine Group I thaumarchaeote]